MNKTPHNRGASEKDTFFSTRFKVSGSQVIINFIALNTPEDESEAPEITQHRLGIGSALHALDHLRLPYSGDRTTLELKAWTLKSSPTLGRYTNQYTNGGRGEMLGKFQRMPPHLMRIRQY
jgi:hypothetical protein